MTAGLHLYFGQSFSIFLKPSDKVIERIRMKNIKKISMEVHISLRFIID
jgi:hypothetical protein